STWLFTIAKRLYVNACQKHRPLYDSEIVGGWQGGGDDADAPTLTGEAHATARDAIGEALDQLGDEQREIVVLFHQQDWPISLIAEYMNMPEGTVKSHLHRGRRKMRKYFEHSDQYNAFIVESLS
ncbi:MAG: RNA polymerase sigma factor, partial [Phycisphaerales bacterium]|nr:RNA polymerase sigma factor [Phycisphaerales bacterium]